VTAETTTEGPADTAPTSERADAPAVTAEPTGGQDGAESAESSDAPESPEAAPSGAVRSRFVAAEPGAATGRRKEAIARVRLVPGTGQWRINGRSLEDYFPNKVHQQIVNEPFVVLGAEEAFDVIARIDGGGVTGQAGALRMGLSRALAILDVEVNRPPLKKAGFLTRDARATERKKYGLKKARKAPQYSKR
jgi:small subunit ribosomal protein S9